MGWYDGNSGSQTHEVGQKKPNAWGLHDMHGNVLEWCADWYDSDLKGGTDPTGPSSGGRRVLRGGSWSCVAFGCRAAFRFWHGPGYRFIDLGFRPALVPPGWETARAKNQALVVILESQNAHGKEIEVELPHDVPMQFCSIPTGSFTMGIPDDEVEVTLSMSFWLAKTEVTQAQWEAVMGSNPSYFNGANRPVENVSWEDAQAYLAKLNEKVILPEGWKFALPTEAQWEYACRAGEKESYSGGCLKKEVGWYDDNSGGITHQVGQKKANAWGLHDMHGNVWEWCEDWYGTLKGGIDPTGPPSGVSRVLRGGSWNSVASRFRADYRFRLNPGDRCFNLGFRPALVPSR